MLHPECFLLKFSILLGLISIIFNIINDCDETFNYLEPANLLISSSKSFQTWEYSPIYALRSYLYLILFVWPSYLIKLFTNFDQIYAFLLLRLSLVLLHVLALSYFHSFSSRLPTIHYKNMHLTLTLCSIYAFAYVLTPAFFISASSFVPSAVSSALTLIHISAWEKKNDFLAVASIAFSAIICWPFTALIGLPYFVVKISTGHLKMLLKYSLFFGFFLSGSQFVVDSHFYGKASLPFLNILKYNVFGNFYFNGTSSELYGTEPMSFYFKNLVLNFNIVFPLFLFSLVFSLLKLNSDLITNLYWKSFSVIFLWFLVFFAQSHKEERFLFPVYPLISLCAAIFVFSFIARIHLYLPKVSIFLLLLFAVTVTVLSCSRMAALANGYSAPIYLTRHLPKCGEKAVLCLGRDWHYFPSHMLLPSRYDVHFIKSSFSGQLPATYRTGSLIEATRSDGGKFNLMNQEESDRFIRVDACDLVLDRLTPVAKDEFDFSKAQDKFSILLTSPIIENHPAPLLSSLTRAFYIPRYSSRHYVQMALFVNNLSRNKCF